MTTEETDNKEWVKRESTTGCPKQSVSILPDNQKRILNLFLDHSGIFLQSDMIFSCSRLSKITNSMDQIQGFPSNATLFQ
jgi:hypothetical protein